jgi:hypothetical protein
MQDVPGETVLGDRKQKQGVNEASREYLVKLLEWCEGGQNETRHDFPTRKKEGKRGWRLTKDGW